MFERGSATTAEAPTAKFAALTLTKSFNGYTPRDIDSLFWISVRGGVVALGHHNCWAAGRSLRFIADQIMRPLVIPHLSGGRTTPDDDPRLQALYVRWGIRESDPASDTAAVAALWAAFMTLVEDYRSLRQAASSAPVSSSSLEDWCMAGINEVRSQPVPGSAAVLTWQRCSIVLPTHNEERTIAETTWECVKTMWQLCPNGEVIIVDNASSDRTGSIADDLAANDATVTVIHNRTNLGYGAALRAGLDVARGDLLFFTDSDGQYDIAEIAKVLVAAREKPGSAVLGYRERRNEPLVRRLGALGWALTSRLLVGLSGIRDIDCAFKLFPAQAFRDADVIAQGVSIDVELLAKFQRMGISMVQVPVTHTARRRGNLTGARPEGIIRALPELLQLRCHLSRWHPPASELTTSRIEDQVVESPSFYDPPGKDGEASSPLRRLLDWIKVRSSERVGFSSRLDLAFLTVIMAAAAVLRLAWVQEIPDTPTSDFIGYQARAVEFFHGQYPPDVTFQGLGYPFALGMVYRLIGSTDILVGKLFNLVLSLATVLLCYFIFSRLTQSRFVVYGALAIVGLLPTYVAYTAVLGTEVLFTFLLALAVALQLCRFDARLRYPLLGIVIGAGALTKPYFLVYPVVVALTLWLTKKDLRELLQMAVLCVSFMLATIAPVTYLNYQEFHMFILNTYNGGYNLFENSNSDNTTGAFMPLAKVHISQQFRAELAQHGVQYPNVPVDQRFAPLEPLFSAEAEKWILSHPLQFAKLGVLRVKNTYFAGSWDIRNWAMDGISDQQLQSSIGLRNLQRIASVSIYILSGSGLIYLLLSLGRIGAAVVRRGRKLSYAAVLPALNVAFLGLVVFVTEGQPRYAFPSLFLLAFCVALVSQTVVAAVRNATPAL
jgi:hypothetical protein